VAVGVETLLEIGFLGNVGLLRREIEDEGKVKKTVGIMFYPTGILQFPVGSRDQRVHCPSGGPDCWAQTF
jgi:hypothetical protein